MPFVPVPFSGGAPGARGKWGQAPRRRGCPAGLTLILARSQSPFSTPSHPILRTFAGITQPGSDGSKSLGQLLFKPPIDRAIVLAINPKIVLRGNSVGVIVGIFVAFAMPDFHERLLAGRAVVIACPKLDDVGPYIDKLTRIFADNSIKSVTVAHMEVPCCTGIVMAARAAMDASGRTDIPFSDITVGIDGTVRSEN